MRKELILSTTILLLLSLTHPTTAADYEGWSILNQGLSFHWQKVSLLMNPTDLVEKWNDLYDALMQTDNYRRKLQEKHEKHGVLRSGEGTAAEIQQRRRLYEEQVLLDEIE